jgi:hypothetical protein
LITHLSKTLFILILVIVLGFNEVLGEAVFGCPHPLEL